MSIQCMAVPPRRNPRGFASFGSTTCTISVADADGRFACRCSVTRPGGLEVVSNPEAERHLPERRRSTGRRKEQILPVLVEQRLPREIEVHREAEQKALEADAVRGAAVDQTEAGDRRRRSEHRGDVAK